MRKNTYMTVAVPGTKKVSVCARRIGTRDRDEVARVSRDLASMTARALKAENPLVPVGE